MNIHMSAQFYQLETEENKIILAISYLIDKAADWIQFYINEKFHSENLKDEKNEIKNKLIKIKWSNNLNKMIKIAVQINNHLWKKQQKKKKKNFWEKQHDYNKNKKKDHR